MIKPEPTEGPLHAPKKQARMSWNDLHIYSNEELTQFLKKELLADVALLEGK